MSAILPGPPSYAGDLNPLAQAAAAAASAATGSAVTAAQKADEASVEAGNAAGHADSAGVAKAAAQNSAALADVARQGAQSSADQAADIVAGIDINASTSQRGVVELATDSEAIAGTDAERAVTPAALKAALLAGGATVPDATTATKGKVRLATEAEASDGASDSIAVTPRALQFRVDQWADPFSSQYGLIRRASDMEVLGMDFSADTQAAALTLGNLQYGGIDLISDSALLTLGRAVVLQSGQLVLEGGGGAPAGLGWIPGSGWDAIGLYSNDSNEVRVRANPSSRVYINASEYMHAGCGIDVRTNSVSIGGGDPYATPAFRYTEVMGDGYMLIDSATETTVRSAGSLKVLSGIESPLISILPLPAAVGDWESSLYLFGTVPHLKFGRGGSIYDVELGVNADWSAVSGQAKILNKPTLAAVATSGSYADLTNKPTLGPLAGAPGTLNGSVTLDGAGNVSAWPGTCIVADHVARTNLTLSGAQTFDGLTTSAGDVILCVAQTAQAENGVYIAAAGAWTRHPLAATGRALKGAFVSVLGKGTNQASAAGLVYRCTTTADIVVGTTAVTYAAPVRFGASGVEVNKWGSSSANLSLDLFGAGGTTPTTTFSRAAGANGALTLTNTGTGLLSAVSGGGLTLTSAATSTITIGGTLTTGTIALGSGSQTAVTAQINGGQTGGATPTVRVSNAQSGGVRGLEIANTSSATTAGKYADITFAGDATPFVGGRIRANNTTAFAWNNASQRMEMVFAVGVGTTLTDSIKVAANGMLQTLRGRVVGVVYATPATGGTVAIGSNDETTIINPAALLATLTITMPTTPADGQVFRICFGDFGVTALSMNPVGPASATFATGAALTAAAASQTAAYVYRSTQNKWFRHA